MALAQLRAQETASKGEGELLIAAGSMDKLQALRTAPYSSASCAAL
jgi:hypothetical protein